MFLLISRYGKEPYAFDCYSAIHQKYDDCLLAVLDMVRSFPKLTNEAYAQVFKLLNNPEQFNTDKFENAILNKKIPRAKKQEGIEENDHGAEGDPGYWFCWQITHCGHPVFAMNTDGPLRYFQVLYALCCTSPPTADFLPFVISYLKGFTKGNQNGLTSLKAREEWIRKEAEERLAKLREKEELQAKENEIWKDRPTWYSEATGRKKKKIDVAPPPKVLVNEYKVNCGSGVIAQYAECCIDMIRKVVKLAERGKPPPVRIGKTHINHLQARPPLLKGVYLDFIDQKEYVFNRVFHIAPWEQNARLKGLICRGLKLKGFEAESMCLYCHLPRLEEARIFPLPPILAEDAKATMNIPMPIPPHFYLGDLGMNDNIKFFRLSLRRKLFFGLPMIPIPPIPRIGLRPGASYSQPLDSINMTPTSEGILFLQFVDGFEKEGILYGYDMPRTRFMNFIGDVWIKWLKPPMSKALIMCSKESIKCFHGKPTYNYEENLDYYGRILRACLLTCRIVVGITLRRMNPTPPVRGVRWNDHVFLSTVGPGALVEYAYNLIPSDWRHHMKKRWWEEEIKSFMDWMLDLLKNDRICQRDLHEVVLFTMGSHVLIGSHKFLIRKSEEVTSENPWIKELADLENNGLFWIYLNPLGLHICNGKDKTRLVTIPYHSITRWTGTYRDIVLTVSNRDDDNGETEYQFFGGDCNRATLLRQVMLEIIHSLMTHQGSGFDADSEEWKDCHERVTNYDPTIEPEWRWWRVGFEDMYEDTEEEEEEEEEEGDEEEEEEIEEAWAALIPEPVK